MCAVLAAYLFWEYLESWATAAPAGTKSQEPEGPAHAEHRNAHTLGIWICKSDPAAEGFLGHRIVRNEKSVKRFRS